MMVDSHCHLSKEDYNDVSLVIKNMSDNIMVFSGASSKLNNEVIDLIEKYDNVYGTLGLHPDEACNYTDSDLKLIEKNINNKKVIGIGEIGLDYHYVDDESIKHKQKELFIRQLDLAKMYNKTVVIHSRDSIEDTFNIMLKYKNLNYIFHCYSSSKEMAYKFIKNFNIKFGIGGVLTFKNSKRLQNVVENIDLKYILLETDCPYMSPEPLRGTINEPYNIIYVAKKIAELKNIDLNTVLKNTTENAFNIYQIKEK